MSETHSRGWNRRRKWAGTRPGSVYLDSVATFLKAASRSRPLMLVLDDLHWADDASLGLLQFVARELGNARVLVVGTYRDVELSRQHPLAETLAELTRERLFTRVLLRGLTAEDIGHFISLTSGVEPPKGLVTAVHRETEGNPLFVTEVVRLLVQEGELTPRDDSGTGVLGHPHTRERAGGDRPTAEPALWALQ